MRKINDVTPEEWNKSSHRGIPRTASEWEHLDKIASDYGLSPHIEAAEKKASDQQVGGNHYKGFAIQPAEFCYKNNIPYLEATAIKYLCRWRDKGGVQDLDKAIHFIQLLKEFSNDS